MRTLLHISDPHFGTEQEIVVEALLRLTRCIAPDVLVVSGDITQRARKRQFSAARAFVNRLNVPQVLCIPGNHDIPLFNVVERMIRPYDNYSQELGEDLEPCYEDEDALIICVNTTRPARHKDGEISDSQIARVVGKLKRATTDQLRIVVTHQPVDVSDDKDLPNLLHGYQAAVTTWNKAGVDIIMGGHIHLPHVRPLSERFPNLERASWSVQAGTALSSRVRSNVPNSVNIIRPMFPACRVERWDFDSLSAEFVLKVAHTLELDRS